MKPGRIHIKHVDDWMAVYLDGVKIYANHSCSLTNGLEALGIPFTSEEIPEDAGTFPERLPDAFLEGSSVIPIGK